MSATTRSALAATVLAVPVLAEIAWPARLDAAGGLLLFAASQLVGWALLAWLVVGAPPAARTASPRGQRVVIAGCALQVSFATVYGATAFDGEPLEASFVLFMLGFITLFVGGLLWAARLRRKTGGQVATAGLLTVAILGALAMLVGSDPFHDLFLVSSYAAWTVVGRGFDTLRSALTPRDVYSTAATSRRNEDGTTDGASARAAQAMDQATPRS
jgi:uncharacterized membrane protein